VGSQVPGEQTPPGQAPPEPVAVGSVH